MSLVSEIYRSKVTLPRRWREWGSRSTPFVFKADKGLLFHLHPPEVLDGAIYADGIFERRLLEYLDRTVRGRTMLDVGANIGNHALYLHTNFRTVHCFEPNPPVVDRLRKNIELNGATNVTVHPFGLGAKDADLPFHSNTTGNLGGGSFVHTQFPVSSTLPVRRGDDLSLQAVDFIKLDVEGFEAEALAGLRETIKRDRPLVVFEYDGIRNEEGFFDRIVSCLPGYRLFEFVGLSRLGIVSLLTGARPKLDPIDRPKRRCYDALFAFP